MFFLVLSWEGERERRKGKKSEVREITDKKEEMTGGKESPCSIVVYVSLFSIFRLIQIFFLDSMLLKNLYNFHKAKNSPWRDVVTTIPKMPVTEQIFLRNSVQCKP